MRKALGVVGAVVLGVLATAPGVLADGRWGGFVPGHIFVSELGLLSCEDRIWEIDPDSGEVTLFADVPSGMCAGMSGLTFTPDGRALRASMYTPGMILEFDPEGNYTIVLDEDDALSGPWGHNNLAYDADGNFYVVNDFTARILRFPSDGGPAEVFADYYDGIRYGGSIAFAADGDLYYSDLGSSLNHVLRITPEGEVFVFDEYGLIINPMSVTADSDGDLYVYVLGNTAEILRYEAGDPDSREPLVSGVVFFSPAPITMSLDETKIYVADFHAVYAVDTANGATDVVADLMWDESRPAGVAVVPLPPLPGDLNGDGVVDLADFAILQGCLGGPGYAPLPADCGKADVDYDGYVDLADFAVLQAGFTGA